MSSAKRILLIQGHPDAAPSHLCHALADAYATGAREAGQVVRVIQVAELEFPLLRSQKEWEEGALPASLQLAQADIRWAEHIVLFFRSGRATCRPCSRPSSNRWPGQALLSWGKAAAPPSRRRA